MGWVLLALLIAGSVGLLWAFKVRGGLLIASAAALMFGAAGYALQGSPTLAGSPVAASDKRDIFPLTDARHAFFGHFTPVEPWLRMSEALARDGKSEDAVNILQNAARRYPGDPQLWIGLGNALVDHAGTMTPPAALAYQRAAQLAPGHPAAPFFYGLALARSGDRDGALRAWIPILQIAPPNAAWRPLVAQGVQALMETANDPVQPAPDGPPPTAPQPQPQAEKR